MSVASELYLPSTMQFNTTRTEYNTSPRAQSQLSRTDIRESRGVVPEFDDNGSILDVAEQYQYIVVPISATPEVPPLGRYPKTMPPFGTHCPPCPSNCDIRNYPTVCGGINVR